MPEAIADCWRFSSNQNMISGPHLEADSDDRSTVVIANYKETATDVPSGYVNSSLLNMAI